jgi:hypothetical protein
VARPFGLPRFWGEERSLNVAVNAHGPEQGQLGIRARWRERGDQLGHGGAVLKDRHRFPSFGDFLHQGQTLHLEGG